ncbi:MAG: lipid-A-disaccharide synthase [Deltaproteobacteria bacterium]|nr:lipid-A-disaccharide synthase [Deltaproteobacteria bacterium]
MENSKKCIFIVAGEASGDLHGARLIQALKEKDRSLTFAGIGGASMKNQGMQCLMNAHDLAVTGGFEILVKLFQILRAFRRCIRFIRTHKPSVIVLIDYPDFNLRLAKKIFKLSVPVVYYIGPQVWAWRKYRVRQIQKWIDRLLVVFPFEKKFYEDAGVPVTFVGHPLLEMVHAHSSKKEWMEKFGWKEDEKMIVLLPGSRVNEIKKLLPAVMEAAQWIQAQVPDVHFVLPVAPSLEKEFLKRCLGSFASIMTLVEGDTYEVISHADVVVTCSGTATLETAILKKPMVILYKLNILSYWVAKCLIRNLRFFGMPNILLSKAVVPELLQGQVQPRRIFEEVMKFLENPIYYREVVQQLSRIPELLGETGASAKAADAILEIMAQSQKKTNKRWGLPGISLINYLAGRAGMVFARRAKERGRELSGNFLAGKVDRVFIKDIPGRPHYLFCVLPVLWFLSKLYGLGVFCRNYFYDHGWLQQTKVRVPVISIGNLTVGGTGKTPLTMVLAKEFEQQGKRVVILSRGYRRRSDQSFACVSDGRNMLLSVHEAGDEPFLMAKKLPSIPVYVGSQRDELARHVLSQEKVDVFLLDDGFQHRRLKRDYDLVTIDATSFFKSFALLPLGRWREPLRNIRRAQTIMLTRVESISESEKNRILRHLTEIHPRAHIRQAHVYPLQLEHVMTDRHESLTCLKDRRIVAFAGIGNPHAFLRQIERLNGNVVAFKSYPDHFFYDHTHRDELIRLFNAHHAEVMVTTEKDAVRLLSSQWPETFPLYALSITLQVKDAFPAQIFSLV